ncbi:MAG: hypothetical protein M1817_001920 [Caeruleum heppii]|nr:MAG: hypothetical protein M1817_001920 [Caeruleum heppii]
MGRSLTAIDEKNFRPPLSAEGQSKLLTKIASAANVLHPPTDAAADWEMSHEVLRQVRLFDKAVADALQQIPNKHRGSYWTADFTKEGEIRKPRKNYGSPAIIRSDRQAFYARYKGYYNLRGDIGSATF